MKTIKKLPIPKTEKEKRECYKSVFEKEFDDQDRKQLPLPLDIACIIAMYVNERDNAIMYV